MDAEYFNKWAFMDQSFTKDTNLSIDEAKLIIECNSNIIRNLRKNRERGIEGYDSAILMLEVFNNYYRIRLRAIDPQRSP